MKYNVGDLLVLQLDTTIWDIRAEPKEYNKGQIFLVASIIKDHEAYIIYSQQDYSFSQWHILNAEQNFSKIH
jgi:hypothetical protein